MNCEYIIVQAGGKGTRMKKLTKNKPKALVPVDNLPILFHLFREYPQKKFIVIGDYKYEVLDKYLKAFADVSYDLVNASGKKGTCSGLRDALALIPGKTPFMLIWCDLVLEQTIDFESLELANYVGCSLGFPCRWKYENGVFLEESSDTCGVAGLFVFKDKNLIDMIPEEGEFVRWLSSRDIDFDTITLNQTKEFGLIETYNLLKKEKCRPFNKITIENDCIVKEGIDEQGKSLAVREKNWYEQVRKYEFRNLPQIYSLTPLRMELVKGKNLYEYVDASYEDKKKMLFSVITCLKKLHELGGCAYHEESFQDAYIDKTKKRLEQVKELVPFAQNETVVVNGKKCRNIFFCWDKVEELMSQYKPEKFVFLHGDCTFSNMLLREEDMEPVMIDPRGYFGKTEFYGDVAYDYAKLYYSIVGNYDRFNLKEFDLDIRENDVVLSVESSGWEKLEQDFFEMIGEEVTRKQIKLIHAIIWLSLTTYAWEDYDSICGAFYNGLWYLEDAIDES